MPEDRRMPKSLMNVRPIRCEEDLAWALTEIAPYFEAPPPPGSAGADRFDVLADLIEAYENRAHPVAAPDPVALIRAHMENTGRTSADLARLLSSRSRASEILGRRRRLTVGMIGKLQRDWGIPAEHLVEPYELVA
jgi:HTH-type transcriptional regulator/antitoxin HigA